MAAAQQLAASSNPSLREYFERKGLGLLLERLVVDIGEARPDDVFAFIEQWAGRERSKRRGSGVTGSPPPATSAAMAPAGPAAAAEAWKQAGSPATVAAQHFFDVLFTQHASLRRKLFAGVDVDKAKAGLAPLLNSAICGELGTEALAALAKEHGAGTGVEAKHFHYFLTAMLTATSIAIGAPAFQQTSDSFRVLYTQIGDALMVGLGLRAASDAAPGQSISLASAWEGISDKPAVCKAALDIMCTQHPTLRKRLLADVNEQELAAAMAEALSAQLAGKLPDDAVIALGKRHGTGRPALEARHFHYLLTAGLTALSRHVPDYAASRDAWRLKLTHATDLLRIGALGEDSEQPYTVGPGVSMSTSAAQQSPNGGGEASIAINVNEAMAALADKPAFDVVRDSWAGLADKRAAVMGFYAVLLTQHGSLGRTVLKDVDLEALVPTIIEKLTALINGTLPVAELAKIAKEHGRPRGAELKHLHYCLSAALSALSLNIGATFPAVAEHWKEVLTVFVDQLSAGLTNEEAAAEKSANSKSVSQEASLSMNPDAANGHTNGAASGGEKTDADGVPLKERVYTEEECIKLARESWAALGEAGKRAMVAETFFSILFTQHPTVKRALFKDLDEAVLAPKLVDALTAAIDAPSFPEIPEVTAMAKEHGAARGAETRHYHYFLSAMLAALAIAIGREAFPPLSEPWRRVLTLIGKAMMAGAPPTDANAVADTNTAAAAAAATA